jgi:hypothetical protein
MSGRFREQVGTTAAHWMTCRSASSTIVVKKRWVGFGVMADNLINIGRFMDTPAD